MRVRTRIKAPGPVNASNARPRRAPTEMNLPVSLTILRIFFVPLVVVLFLTQRHDMDVWAVGVFLLASTTDLLDGYLARKRKQITSLGILLDPLADKLLIAAAFISLVELQLVPAWMALIIIGRDLAVTGLRSVAAAEGFALQASEWGKTKMVVEVVAIAVVALEPRFRSLVPLGEGLLWLAVLSALLSAEQYFSNFWRTLNRRSQQRPAAPLVVLPGGKEKDDATAP